MQTVEYFVKNLSTGLYSEDQLRSNFAYSSNISAKDVVPFLFTDSPYYDLFNDLVNYQRSGGEGNGPIRLPTIINNNAPIISNHPKGPPPPPPGGSSHISTTSHGRRPPPPPPLPSSASYSSRIV